MFKIKQKNKIVESETSTKRIDEPRKREFTTRTPPFDAARIINSRVDKYSTIVVDQNHYSIPDHLVGEVVCIKVYSNHINCFYEETPVATHPRKMGNQEWNLQLEHYLDTLKKKPGELASSVVLQQANQKIKQIYTQPRDFIELIRFIQSGTSLKEMERSIEELLILHPIHVTTDKIKQLCAKQKEPYNPPTVYSSQKTIDIEQCSKQHLQIYDQMYKCYLKYVH